MIDTRRSHDFVLFLPQFMVFTGESPGQVSGALSKRFEQLRKRNEFTKLLCSSGLPDIGEKGRFCHEAGWWW